MHKDSHQSAHDKCHFGIDTLSWTHNVKYMDIDEHSKKSLDITDKRFCSEDQRKEVGPKVAQMEFTVYMLVMKICYEDHYKGNPESIANYRRKQTEVFKQFLPKLKTVV
uniref:Ulp1 protease family, C-terminal catalytic domain-containing protein n=1 Tax=Steinernema glaseri TaxID=37863 RepID=A0A1I7ZNZ2_9BILA